MSADLEKRLREAHEIEFSDEALRLMSRAADELARLRAENEALTVILNLCTEGTEWTYAQVPDEIAALRRELADLKGAAK